MSELTNGQNDAYCTSGFSPPPTGEQNRKLSPLQSFAERHNLRIKLDSCRDHIIPGKKTASDMPGRVEYWNHIYDHGDGVTLGVCLMLATKMRWTYAKKKLTAAGFVLRQDGDTEGTLLFDPADAKQARLAIRIVGAKRRRELTAGDRLARAASLKRARAVRDGRGRSLELSDHCEEQGL